MAFCAGWVWNSQYEMHQQQKSSICELPGCILEVTFVACWLIGQQQEVYYFKHIIRSFTN
jgi:hypothetical protein